LSDVNKETFIGKDYYNPRVAAPSALHKWEEDQFDRNVHPRMPWQDVQILVDGEAAKDVALNFIQRWNVCSVRRQGYDSIIIPDFLTSDKQPGWPGDLVVYVDKAVEVAAADWNGLSDPYVVVTCRQDRGCSCGFIPERRGHNKSIVIKTTLNPVWNTSFVFPNLLSQGPMTFTFEVYDSDFNTVGSVTRLLGLTDRKKKVSELDDFLGKVEMKIDMNTLLGRPVATFQESMMSRDLKKRVKGTLHFGFSYAHPYPLTKITVPNTIPNVKVQVLRSISHWSCGASGYEDSLYSQYLRLISEAKHYIYIESQFFISSTATTSSSSSPVVNQIANYLIDRITQAIEKKETFRVIIIVPLHPEGSMLDSTTQAVFYWQARTLRGNGEHSFFGKLHRRFPDMTEEDLEKYVVFYSLYQKDKLNQSWVSEQIYVHTKLIITDDQEMIIGSQNINDRSMSGTRDSELGVYVHHDPNQVNAVLGGKSVQVSSFVRAFRLRLWKEHLGLHQMDFQQIIQNYGDAICNEVYVDRWLEVARKNTETFGKCFPYMPKDVTTKLSQYRSAVAGGQFARYVECLEDGSIQGTLILHPTRFLADSLEELRHAISDHLFQ